MSTYDANSWYIDNVKNAINDGKITYIGDYKEPDYELITASGSEFAIFFDNADRRRRGTA